MLASLYHASQLLRHGITPTSYVSQENTTAFRLMSAVVAALELAMATSRNEEKGLRGKIVSA